MASAKATVPELQVMRDLLASGQFDFEKVAEEQLSLITHTHTCS